MNIRFYIDEESGLPHISNHGVDEDEVEQILARPGEDAEGREGARVAMGQTRSGRYIKVIYVPDDEEDLSTVFVITAYELRGKPLASYMRRKRRKQR